MNLPPNIAATATAITTSGTANTLVNTLLIAAPGAGFRLRLWGWALAAKPNNTGLLRILLKIGAAGAYVAGASFGAGQGTPGLFIPGGVALTSNAALTVDQDSSVISQPFTIMVYTTQEAG